MKNQKKSRWLAAALLAGQAWAYAAQPPTGQTLLAPQPGDGAATGQTLVQGAWGAAPGEFGKVDEASRPGPMDFALSGGLLYVLDPVNGRVQAFDSESGALRREVAIGTRTADFLSVDSTGNVTVLDAFVRRELRTFDASAAPTRTLRLPDEIRLASAVFTDADRVWIEERHDKVFEIAAPATGEAAAARVVQTLSGRPLPSGKRLHAHKAGDSEIALRRTSANSDETLTTVRFGGAVASVAALEADAAGNAYLAVRCPRKAADGRETADIVVARIGADGQSVGSLALPDLYATDHYRKLLVTPAGEVIQMQTTEEGVRFVRYRFGSDGGERSVP